MNAFAIGRPSQSAICLTDGLLKTMDTRELAGVLAHEVSHIDHNDLWVMSRMTSLLSWVGILILLFNVPLAASGYVTYHWILPLTLTLSPIIMSFMQLALSRNREYSADLGVAELTGDPEGLARALGKLERYRGRFWEDIIYPGRRIPEPSLLRSHPPTKKRIERLRDLSANRGIVFHEQMDNKFDVPVRVLIRPPRYRRTGVWY